MSKKITKTTEDVTGNEGDEEETWGRGGRNSDVGRRNNVPTAHSRLHVAKIGDIYRCKPALSPAYLNNAMDYDIELKTIADKWIRI